MMAHWLKIADPVRKGTHKQGKGDNTSNWPLATNRGAPLKSIRDEKEHSMWVLNIQSLIFSKISSIPELVGKRGQLFSYFVFGRFFSGHDFAAVLEKPK